MVRKGINMVKEIVLNNKTYKGKIDVITLSNYQKSLSKIHKKKIGLKELADFIKGEEIDAIVELFICTVQRVQEVDRKELEDLLDFNNITKVTDFITELINI